MHATASQYIQLPLSWLRSAYVTNFRWKCVKGGEFRQWSGWNISTSEICSKWESRKAEKNEFAVQRTHIQGYTDKCVCLHLRTIGSVSFIYTRVCVCGCMLMIQWCCNGNCVLACHFCNVMLQVLNRMYLPFFFCYCVCHNTVKYNA